MILDIDISSNFTRILNFLYDIFADLYGLLFSIKIGDFSLVHLFISFMFLNLILFVILISPRNKGD